MFLKIKQFFIEIFVSQKDLIQSKKFRAAIIGVIATIAAKLGLDVSPEELTLMVSPIVAYILGQGLADFSKEKDKKEETKPQE